MLYFFLVSFISYGGDLYSYLIFEFDSYMNSLFLFESKFAPYSTPYFL